MSLPAIRTELKTWKFTLDQTKYGLGAGWIMPEYDDSRWIEVETYTSWETFEYAMDDFEGQGIFRTWYEATKKSGNRHVLKFDGVGGTAEVYVNGRLMGKNDNRYLPFDIDITAALKDSGKNLIAVIVNNAFRGRDHLPGAKTTEWVLYGGLNHRIYVEEQPAVYITNARIEAAANGEICAMVTVENRTLGNHPEFTGSVQLTVEGISDLVLEQEVFLGAKEIKELVFTGKAEGIETWSPDHPNLYYVNLTMSCKGEAFCTRRERFGFRTIEVQGTKILLNGEEIYLKGANRYDEYAPYGINPPEELIRKDFMDMKACGLNLVRTHYPQDEIHYRIADEVGIMYMIEVPINWWVPKDTETLADFCGLAAEAVDCTDRTIRAFGNHPCWTIWSTGNECSHSHPACQQMFRMIAERMRSFHTNRLITYASNKPLLNSEELDFCDFLSMNYYSGILSENASQFPEQLNAVLSKKMETAQELYPNVPHVMTEFGYVCVRGLHGSLTEGRFTEDFGSTFLKADLAEFMKNPLMRGMIIWCWADYRHRRGFAGGGMHLSATYGPYGIVTMDRKVKTMIWDVMQHFYTNWHPTQD